MSSIQLLPLDITGNSLSHRFLQVPQTLIRVPGRDNRLLVPDFGSFFEDNLVIEANGSVLVKNRDYVLSYYYRDLSVLSGKPVYGMIVFINPAVPNTVLLTCRAVGGPFTMSTQQLTAALDALKEDTISFTFEDMVGTPTEWPAEEHTHEWWQLYGAEKTKNELIRIEEAILAGDSSAFEYERVYGDTLYVEAEAAIIDVKNRLDDHLIDLDNPHQTTAAGIGLGSVQDYPMSTNGQGIAGSSNNSYMSPGTTFQALLTHGVEPLNNHMTNYSNPHGLSYSQIGAYSTSVLNNLIIDGKLGNTETAYDSLKFDGRDYTTVYNAVRTNLNAANIVGVLPPERLASGTPSASTILIGNQWLNATDVFDQYGVESNKVVYAGYQGNDADALAFIGTTYANINSYPVGTVVIYTVQFSYVVGGGNGAGSFTQRQLSAAVRTADGWTTM